ncbi:hypothetical protein Q0O45_13445, partial [Staphylococcus aureus]|nr:hypothetical protein [Staphylococcus aureus]
LVRRGKTPKKCGVPDPVDEDEDDTPAEGHTEAPAPEAQQPAPEAEKEKATEHQGEGDKAAEEWKEEHPKPFDDEGKHPEQEEQ